MIRFSEIEYQRPDIEALKTLVSEATQKVAEAKSVEEIRDAYFAVQETENVVDTMYTVAHIRNTIDTADEFYEKEVLWLEEQEAALIPLNKEYLEAFASSPFRKDFEAEFGPQLLRRIDAQLKTRDEKIIRDTVRQGELCMAYSKSSAAATIKNRIFFISFLLSTRFAV